MREFVHIPKDMWPDISKHVEYLEVYRATQSTDQLQKNDFLPSNIEYRNQQRTFRNTFSQTHYGLSVFTDLQSLKNTVERFPALRDRKKAYAKGYTTIERGVSLQENANHHVDYFLYDYENNNPKDDFIIVEVRTEHEG